METENLRKRVNQEFLIKYNDGSESTLLGWSGLVQRVGLSKARILARTALASIVDIYTWSGRNGRKIRFYAK